MKSEMRQSEKHESYVCPDCGYVYRPEEGCEREGYSPGTAWSDIPDDFPCPECFVREKPDFVAQSEVEEVA